MMGTVPQKKKPLRSKPNGIGNNKYECGSKNSLTDPTESNYE